MNALVSTPAFPNHAEDLFNSIFRDSVARQDGYPPYNSWSESDGTIKIEIAVSGFSRDELTVHFDGRTLSIIGEKIEAKETDNKKWIYRGLAKRKFNRYFNVNGAYAVNSAILKNGVLTIALKDETHRTVIEVKEE